MGHSCHPANPHGPHGLASSDHLFFTTEITSKRERAGYSAWSVMSAARQEAVADHERGDRREETHEESPELEVVTYCEQHESPGAYDLAYHHHHYQPDDYSQQE